MRATMSASFTPRCTIAIANRVASVPRSICNISWDSTDSVHGDSCSKKRTSRYDMSSGAITLALYPLHSAFRM